MHQIKSFMEYQKGRGAQFNPANRFESQIRDDGETQSDKPTKYTIVYPKTILNKVDSPDIGMAWSLNPYQGCEHGCVYCYARNSHNYWGYSAGLDFEQQILVKKNAAHLLEKKLQSPKWEAAAIMLSGNTDCYQPAEKEFKLTRRVLEVLWRYRHPVGLITKNSLVLRDLDILEKLAQHHLVRVSVSLTTLNEGTRRILEPRTASAEQRLRTIRELSRAGVSVNVMLAPIIPGLNDHEILAMAEAAAEAGAVSMASTIVRLNGDVADIFQDWVRRTLPDRADRILNRIRDCHGGRLNDSRFGTRMRGEGKIAEIIQQQLLLAKARFFSEREKTGYNLELHEKFKRPQMRLF